MLTMPEEFFQKALHVKGLLVLVEKASFSKEFRLEFYSGGEGETRNVLEIVIKIQNEILDEQKSSGLFSNETFEKKPVMTIEDFLWHSDDHFESQLLGNGLYP